MADLIVAGAGMAGLVAAVQARRRGAEVELHEKLDRPGGSMRLSSGVVWRHRELADFRRDCPQGDPALQRLVFERLDGDLDWLGSLGAPVLARETGNPRTRGWRFDPAGLTEALLRAAGPVRLEDPLRAIPGRTPVVLATGGFAADRELVRRHVTPQADHLLLRAAPGATGDGLRLGIAAGGRASAGLDQAYGRNMPAPPAGVGPHGYVALAQLYGRAAEITNRDGDRYEARSWSEIDVFQWTARQPGARAWFRIGEERLGNSVGGRAIATMIDAAEAAGARVRREDGTVLVETVAGITSTLGGLAVDERCRIAAQVFAAGGDVGGIATGGYSSGLAAALVLGRIAADAALDGA